MKALVKINEVNENPNNPRIIKDFKFNKLVASIKEFPEMLEKRPIVVDENMVVLGGNMRLKACKDAGLKEIWIDKAEGWSEEQKQEFIIKDNVSYGQWSWDILANEYEIQTLEHWGLEVWQQTNDGFDPNLMPETSHADVTEAQIQKKAKELAEQMLKESKSKDIICPYCEEEFSIDE